MASKKTTFAVGLFVAGGITISMISIILLGMSRFMEKGSYYVTYFNESVQGLAIDSPVKYQGVPIGRVERISVAPDSQLIQVVMKIETGQGLKNNIVAQLKAVGITGSMFVELDRKQPDEPDLSPSLSFPSEYPIVPSKPSEITKIIRGVDEVLQQLKSIDLQGISEKIKVALDATNRVLVEVDIKTLTQKFNLIMDQASRSLASVEETLKGVEGITSEKETTIKAAIEDFREAITKTNQLLEGAGSLVRGADNSLTQVKQPIITSVKNLEKATENLNRFLEVLADQPSQALFGQPPERREIEE
jgi:phospholipid/cholesterol/gamma-HCH transport system substrate-binding protein